MALRNFNTLTAKEQLIIAEIIRNDNISCLRYSFNFLEKWHKLFGDGKQLNYYKTYRQVSPVVRKLYADKILAYKIIQLSKRESPSKKRMNIKRITVKKHWQTQNIEEFCKFRNTIMFVAKKLTDDKRLAS